MPFSGDFYKYRNSNNKKKTTVKEVLKPAKEVRKSYSITVKITNDERVTAEGIMENVLPSFSGRVNRVIETRGFVIVTFPTEEEDRTASLKSASFAKEGLVANERESFSKRIKMQYVHKNLSMEDLKVALAKLVGTENCDDSMRVTRRKMTNVEDVVLLDVTYVIAEKLKMESRINAKWFSFPIWEMNKPSVIRCYRCFVEHMAYNCRQDGQKCIHCGEIGHIADECLSGVNCRDCKADGKASGHRMLSMGCPLYRKKIANKNVR